MPWEKIIISKLQMINFKRFYGEHTLDLMPEPDVDRSLILIGGDNGRGKTSIHEAINYALYEDDDLPGIQTRPNYIRAVSERLNRKALDEGSTDYGIILELKASDGSAERDLCIERRWEVDIGKRKVLNSNLQIFENNRPVDWIGDSPTAYQDFIRSILPSQIAPYFFFDGERIQELADHEKTDIVNAIEDILHITVYKQLRNDLKTYVVEHIEKNEIKKATTDDFYQLQEDAERLETEIEEKKDRFYEIEGEIESLTRRQKIIESELRRSSGPHASERDELILEKQRIELELKEVRNNIQKGFEPLPILFAGKIKDELNQTLLEEMREIIGPERVEHLKEQLETIEKRVFTSPKPSPPEEIALNKKQEIFYRELFRSVSSDVLGLTSSTQRKRLHDIGERERQQILDRISSVSQISLLLRDAIDRRERLTNELRDLETKLQSTSDDPHIEELINENRNIAEKIGELQGERTRLEGDIQRLEADLAKRKRQIEHRQEQRKARNEAEKTIKRAQKTRRALDDFIKKLAPEKLEILKNHFEEMYFLLKKDEDPIQSVSINPETWQIVLLDDRGRPLEKRVFSAGMREIYALSLLWALAKASGRELPIVIDTPVARLDRTNRRSLFEKYLPHAGHQVIVLSTDTEVDVQWAQRLSPNVAKQYRLDYESEHDSTIIRPGYFF